jgi:predicted nucleic-acid-binding protein
MIALDTNVVVRVVTGDDEAQASAAAAVMRSGSLWLAKTVLLETEWVLRGAYGLDRETILATLRKLVGLRGLRVEDEPAVLAALDAFGAGLDLADALHLASSSAADELVTFDRRLVHASQDLNRLPRVLLLST